MMQRREFIKFLGLSTLTAQLPSLATAANAFNGQRLILIELKGGNDGLNTLIPYSDTSYYEQRPQVAIPAEQVLKLDERVGMHPALKPLLPLWQQGQMAWIQGAGYNQPNRSHFRAIEIWDSAATDKDDDPTGWVVKHSPQAALQGIAINTSLGPLYSEEQSVLGLDSVDKFVKRGRRMQAMQYQTPNDSLTHILSVQNNINEFAQQLLTKLENMPPAQYSFPNNRFGKELSSLYQLIASGFPVPALKVSLGGFDTHANQLPQHQKQLSTLAQGLAVLQQNLAAIGQWDNTLIMSYSEFGRRLRENASRGTDHGAASVQLILGGRVHGGLYGRYPSLQHLDSRGDLIYSTDFRDVYAAVAGRWWGMPANVSGDLMFV